MADPYIGEIRVFSFGWNPRGYALCNGQDMEISQNQALYSLLGMTFGGDGRTTFNLPDLRSRVPVGTDYSQQPYQQGVKGGVENVTLTADEMAAHTHEFYGTSQEANGFFMDRDNDDILAFASGSPGGDPAQPVYGAPTSLTQMAPQTSTSVGGGQSHYNIQPTSVINFCIALQGTYPSRN
jgi:microcystin-dependent protein